MITIARTPVAPSIHEYFTAQGWPYPGWSVYNPNKDGNTWKRVAYNTNIAIGGCEEFEFIGRLPDTSQWKKFQADLSGESGFR